MLVAGEPGGGEPEFRARLERGWGARVTEAMGIGDIGPSLWGECEQQTGMHLGARGFVHPELIDPETGAAVPHGGRGLRRAGADPSAAPGGAPLLRFRTRDHVEVRVAVPVRAHGAARALRRPYRRHADRPGVNVFPSAIREVVSGFAPQTSGHILVKPRVAGVKQDPRCR